MNQALCNTASLTIYSTIEWILNCVVRGSVCYLTLTITDAYGKIYQLKPNQNHNTRHCSPYPQSFSYDRRFKISHLQVTLGLIEGGPIITPTASIVLLMEAFFFLGGDAPLLDPLV